jgi:Uma2 family endonuclease
MMASKTLLSLEQFEQLPDDGMCHELDEGELISMPPTFGIHGKIQTQVVRLIPESLGLTLIDTGFLLAVDSLRAPDVAFFSAERARGLDLTARLNVPPDLAVEIISPSETAANIAHKVRQYLAAGVKVVWVVYPRDYSIHVFESSGSARVLGADDLLEAPDLLPGFSVRVSQIFA